MVLTRARVGAGLASLIVVLTAFSALRLGALEREGPAHADVSIGDGIPATLYLPFEDDDGALPYQRPERERPPVVVVAHGYSADQAVMSPMARSLAEAGYAVLTFDFRGHGSNTNHFSGDLTEDLAAVVDWLERSPQVDGTRIAVLGHSMGASAVLDFATLDDRPLAVIPVSGGHQLYDDVLPDSVFLMVAENDPDRIHARQANIAADLADTDSHVISSEIAGKDHVTILYSNTAITEVVEFLDPIMGIERAGEPPGLADPRLAVAARSLALTVVVVGLLGLLVARFVEPAESSGGPGGLLLIAGALVLTYPIMATGGVNVLPLGAGQPVISQLALAAGLLWGLRVMVQREVITGPVASWIGTDPWLSLRTVVGPGLAAGAAVFVLFLPLGGVIHRLVPTPERLVLWIIVTAMALPFFAAFEALVRRGGTWAALGWGLLGRLVLLLALVVGLGMGVLPPVIGLVVPLLVGQYVLLEVFAATCYARGRNPAVIAVTESVVIAWIVVTLTPIG
ncbi:MAG: alpha/beta hydrolase family protein [Acidimicrobiales bacterium]